MDIVEELKRQAELIMKYPIDEDDLAQAQLLIRAADEITKLRATQLVTPE